MTWLLDLWSALTGLFNRESDRHKEIKDAYYADLVNDFKMGLASFRDGFLIGREHAEGLFSYARALDSRDELNRIGTLNPHLVTHIRTVIQEIYPEIQEADKQRNITRKQIESAWEDYINQLRET